MYSSFYLSMLYSSILSSPIVINTVEFMLLHLLIPTLNVYHYLIGDNRKLKLIYYKNTFVYPSDEEDGNEEDSNDEDDEEDGEEEDGEEEDGDEEDGKDETNNSSDVEGDIPKLLSARNNLIMFSSLLNSEMTNMTKTESVSAETETVPAEAETTPAEVKLFLLKLKLLLLKRRLLLLKRKLVLLKLRLKLMYIFHLLLLLWILIKKIF